MIIPAISSAIYPNPTTGLVNATLNNIPNAGRAKVSVYSSSGIVQSQFNASLQKGDNLLRWNFGSLKRGTYQVVIEYNGQRIIQKLIRL